MARAHPLSARHIFSLEQLEYNNEGIDWSDIDWYATLPCVRVCVFEYSHAWCGVGLTTPSALISLSAALVCSRCSTKSRACHAALTSRCSSSSTLALEVRDIHMLCPLLSRFAGNQGSHYVRPRMANTLFGIRHFAGEVMYDITGMLDKNRDAFREVQWCFSIFRSLSVCVCVFSSFSLSFSKEFQRGRGLMTCLHVVCRMLQSCFRHQTTTLSTTCLRRHLHLQAHQQALRARNQQSATSSRSAPYLSIRTRVVRSHRLICEGVAVTPHGHTGHCVTLLCALPQAKHGQEG